MGENDSFRLFTEAEIGALIGTVVAGLFLYDMAGRIVEWLCR